MQRGTIHLKNETIASFPRYLVSRGVPLPASWGVKEPEEVSIRDEDGVEVPSTGKVLQRRTDGSIEWMLADFIVDLGPEGKKTVHIEKQPNGEPDLANPVRVSEDEQSVTVTNGITELVLSRQGKIVQSLTMHGREIVGENDRVDLETVDREGKIYRASVSDGYTVTIEHRNPLRATILVEGKHAARDGATFLDFALRFTVSADRPDVKLMHTFYCREPETGVIEVKAIRFVMPTRMSPDADKLVRQSHHGRNWFPRGLAIKENVEAVSSCVSDLNAYAAGYQPYKSGVLFLRNLSSFSEDSSEYPFYIKMEGGTEFRADYSTGGIRQIYPFIGWRSPDLTLAFSMRWWPQLHPKSVSIDENILTVSIWPEWSALMRIVQGVNKSHTFWITGEPRELSVDEIEQKSLQWQIHNLEPLEISMDPAWNAFCEVLDGHHFLQYQPEKHAKLEERLSKVVPGEPSRFTYARNNPTGMFNFGDAGGADGFTNNEDDHRCLVPLLEYLRTGRVHCFDFGEENVSHYMEVDFVEWSSVPRKNGGLIPHTVNHFFGEVYPSHQWAEGILAYYYLTGDERARKAVIKVGDCQCYWARELLDSVCCDGREAGIPLVNLAAAYRLTRDEKYVETAWTIINNFQKKWYDQWGDLKYPYPQGAHLKWITGYGDYSSYYGLYRMWEVTGDEEIKALLVALSEKLCKAPERFSIDDSRAMDFFAVWAYIHLTGDDSVLETLKEPIDNFLEKGGHAMRRLHFLGYLDRRGDERLRLG